MLLFYIKVVSFDFEDYFFDLFKVLYFCVMCGVDDIYLDEVIIDDDGNRMFVCFDIDYCDGC